MYISGEAMKNRFIASACGHAHKKTEREEVCKLTLLNQDLLKIMSQYQNYRDIVLKLLNMKKVPVLQDHVLMDVYYKMIPSNLHPVSSYHYHRQFHRPKDVYEKDTQPFALTYLVSMNTGPFYVNKLDEPFRTDSFPMNCIKVKLNRSYIDRAILHRSSAHFEEEIYHFLALLNIDVPRVHPVLNLDFISSTRFLPQRIDLWVSKYVAHPIEHVPVTRDQRQCFGPTREGLPLRIVTGHLSECTSHSTLLSLNNDRESIRSYTSHYAVQWKTLVTLAFNPLENPLIHCRDT